MPLSHFAPGFVSAGQLNALVDQINALSADTGWLDITNINSAYTTAAWQYRIKNGDLAIRGSLTRTTGSVTVGETVCGLAAGTFPTGTGLYRIPFQSNGTVGGHLALSTAGVVTVAQVSGATSQIIVVPVPIPMD